MHEKVFNLIMKLVEGTEESPGLADADHPFGAGIKWEMLCTLVEFFKDERVPLGIASCYIERIIRLECRTKMRPWCAGDDPRETPFLKSETLRRKMDELRQHLQRSIPPLAA